MQSFWLSSGCSCAAALRLPLPLRAVKWLRWPRAALQREWAGLGVSLLLAGLLRLRARWDPQGFILTEPRDGAGLLSGAWRPGGKNPAGVPRAGSPPTLHSSLDSAGPGGSICTLTWQKHSHFLPISPRNSPQQAWPSASSPSHCLAPRHHLWDTGSAPVRPSFSAQSAWKNQSEDAELKRIFLGTAAAAVGLGAAGDGLLAALLRQRSAVRNKAQREIYFRAYSYPSSSAHRLGFPLLLLLCFAPCHR